PGLVKSANVRADLDGMTSLTDMCARFLARTGKFGFGFGFFWKDHFVLWQVKEPAAVTAMLNLVTEHQRSDDASGEFDVALAANAFVHYGHSFAPADKPTVELDEQGLRHLPPQSLPLWLDLGRVPVGLAFEVLEGQQVFRQTLHRV